jgi:HEAT repeat protein
MNNFIADTQFSDPVRSALKSFSKLGEVFRVNLGQKTKITDFEILQQLVSVSTATSEADLVGALSSTTVQEIPEHILDQFQKLFDAGREEVFEDGIQTAFSKRLTYYIEGCGEVAIEALTQLIVGGQVNSEVASEALRWIGRMHHSASFFQRLLLLERCLNSSSSRVRDGAVLGLASIDEPSAIPYLERAIAKEQIEELRQDMIQVLEQLRATQLENVS